MAYGLWAYGWTGVVLSQDLAPKPKRARFTNAKAKAKAKAKA